MKNERKEAAKRKKRRKVKLVCFLSVIFVLLLVFFLLMEIFQVKTVEVEGNDLYDDQKISQWVCNDRYSWNSLYVFLKYRLQKTKEVPFVDSMEVRLAGPTKLHVAVYEKALIGYFYREDTGENVYFDKDGFVTEISTDLISGVPKITGVSIENATLYEKLDLSSSTRKTLLNLTQALTKYELTVDSIDYAPTGNICLYFGQIEVDFGDKENMTAKLKRLKAILPSLEGQSGILHMESWTNDTTDITFEKKE